MSGLLAVFSFLTTANAQNDGLLWKVSGNGLKKPSYLFGTIHIHCNPSIINKPNLLNALKACDTLAMELNLSDFQVISKMLKLAEEPSGYTLKSIFTPKEYKSVDSACRVLLNDSLINLDSESLMELYSKLAFSKTFTGCSPLVPIDLAVMQHAISEQKSVIGLETIEFQDSLLDNIPRDVLAKYIVDFCRDLKKSKADFDKLFALYNSQNLSGLYKHFLATSPELFNLNDALLVQRNNKWVTYLKARMAFDAYFVAVGAAHLAGEDGLIALLRKAGYTLTPVKF